jgi:hypothetical protein
LPAVAAPIAAKAKGYATGQVVKNHFGAAEGMFSIVRAPSSPSHHLNDLHRTVCKRINAP